MACPRCQFAEPTPPDCPRCGVVFAKLERAKPASRPESTASFAEPSGRRLGGLDAALLLASLGALAMIGWRWNHPEPPPEARVAATEPTEAQPARVAPVARTARRIALAIARPSAVQPPSPGPGGATRPACGRRWCARPPRA